VTKARTDKKQSDPAKPGSDAGPSQGDPMEGAKRIMKRLTEMPPKPHQPLGARQKSKERPTSKAHVHKGKTRN
jgi:hypothetical protein